MDSKTRAILVNNPSNPTGSVYTKQHLVPYPAGHYLRLYRVLQLDLLAFAQKHRLVVIADEIYGNLVFKYVILLVVMHAYIQVFRTVRALLCLAEARLSIRWLR